MRLAAPCAQGTLNFYLTHVRSAWATASFPSPTLQLPLACSGFHIVSTRGNKECFGLLFFLLLLTDQIFMHKPRVTGLVLSHKVSPWNPTPLHVYWTLLKTRKSPNYAAFDFASLLCAWNVLHNLYMSHFYLFFETQLINSLENTLVIKAIRNVLVRESATLLRRCPLQTKADSRRLFKNRAAW